MHESQISHNCELKSSVNEIKKETKDARPFENAIVLDNTAFEIQFAYLITLLPTTRPNSTNRERTNEAASQNKHKRALRTKRKCRRNRSAINERDEAFQ